MAEKYDKASKTEEPTEKKIRDSIEKGRVPYSREAAAFASISAILIAAFFFLTDNALRVRFALANFIDNPGGFSLKDGSDAAAILQAVAADAAVLVLPLVIVIAIGGVAASLLQNQPQLVPERIRPQVSRISLTQGWTRIFGLHGQVEFLKALFKLAIVGCAGWVALAQAHEEHWLLIFQHDPKIRMGYLKKKEGRYQLEEVRVA